MQRRQRLVVTYAGEEALLPFHRGLLAFAVTD
jgi:hypothetical protein